MLIKLLPNVHVLIMLYMLELGYDIPDIEGICYGITSMAIQAFLADDMEAFNARLEIMSKISYEKIQSEIERVKSKRSKSEPLTEEELLIEEMLAFFDGVDLYQHLNMRKEMLNLGESHRLQDFMTTSPFVLSRKLEKKGGISPIERNVNMYSQKELEAYFKILAEKINAHDAGPFAILLSCPDHAITVCYDSRKAEWLMIDANLLPEVLSVSLKDPRKLAEKISDAFVFDFKTNVLSFFGIRSSLSICLTSEVYAAKSEVENVNNIFKELNQDNAWKNLHSITESKAKLLDSMNRSLLYEAARDGDVKLIKELIIAGADINRETKAGETPLYVAIINGCDEAAKILLEAGAVIDQQNKKNSELLSSLVRVGKNELCLQLIKAGVDVNAPDENGLTPLLSAIIFDNVKMVQLLLNSKASDAAVKIPVFKLRDYIKYFSFETPIQELLAKKNAYYNVSITPEELAVTLNRKEIVSLLKKHRGVELDTVADEIINIINHEMIDPLNTLLTIKNNSAIHSEREAWMSLIELLKKEENKSKAFVCIIMEWEKYNPMFAKNFRIDPDIRFFQVSRSSELYFRLLKEYGSKTINEEIESPTYKNR